MQSFSIIDRLRTASPAKRPELLEITYRNNLELFRKKYPQILDFVQNTTCPYHLNITDGFVEVVHSPSGNLAHPQAGLDHFAELMGDWVHDAWVELFNFKVPYTPQYPIHYGPISDYKTSLSEMFPESRARFESGRINLKEAVNGKKFSPPTIFLGIFHGLHIAHYLSRTELASALFIEPEPERFEVSCYFLDYTEIDRRFGTLHISIGSRPGTPAIETFFSLLRITPQVWVRVLPGYPSDHMPYIIEVLKGLQSTNADLVYPLDHELKGLLHGRENLRRQHRVLSRQPRVSNTCRIAVVATGPSLTNDLEWLRENQERLIIFAVHSAVRVLRRNGIRPDFQFNLDAVIESDDWPDQLYLSKKIPFVTDYKVPPSIADQFRLTLLCADVDKQGAVSFPVSLENTHPSTTNLAVSFACFCGPAELYFFGCDFGYRKVEQDHASGSIYDEDAQKRKLLDAKKSVGQNLVEPNFPDTDPIITIATHLRTKLVMERCLMKHTGKIKVMNCSDGARIVGAVPRQSASIKLPEYPEKQQDCLKIRQGFQTAVQGENWHAYQQGGAERLRILKKDLKRELELSAFDWKEFSLVLDRALTRVLVEKRGEADNDTRMEIYYRFLVDLLKLWYGCLILFDAQEDAEAVYREGYRIFRETLDALYWPEELDC